MNTALVTIAKSITDVLGLVGAESLLMRSIILKYWRDDAAEMADRVIEACINFNTGEVRPENADGILSQYRIKLGEDFINAVLEEMPMVINAAYDKGREYLVDRMMSGAFLAQKRISDDIIANLSYITGSKKESIYNTVSRWFREYQGKYLERFIVPETARLMSYAGTTEGRIDTMRAIGQRYRDFVAADGYWSAVSEYNTETAKVFSQIQLLQEMNITHYRIEAILDPKTCAVCEFMHGTEWEVTQAVERMQNMIIAEADNAREVNPFPPRSTPKDFEDPQETGYCLPPYHPRCRCNLVTTSSVTLAPRAIPTSQGIPIKPSDNSLKNVFNTHIMPATTDEVQSLTGELASLAGLEDATGIIRELKKAELKRMGDAFSNIPYELRKWAVGNRKDFKVVALAEDTGIPSRVMGNVIQINEKYLRKGVGSEVIEHELRHALLNTAIIDSRKGARGAESLWDTMRLDKKTKFRMPIHVNNMYKLNGGRGEIAAYSAVDEFIAMVGDYYRPGMSLDKLAKRIRDIEVEKVIGSLATDYATAGRWTAAEAKRAAQLWWEWVDVDNYTLMSKKQLLATMNYKPSTAAVQRVALENELRLRDLLKDAGLGDSLQLGDNEPFDVWIGGNPSKFYSGGYKKYMPNHVIEVKTIVRAKNDKITMHPESLAKKKAELKTFSSKGTVGHTVVFDERTGKIYYREGLGSFRLSSMQEVTENQLVEILGGKTRVVEAPKTLGSVPVLDAKKITKKTRFTEDEGAGVNESFIIKAKTGPKGRLEKYFYKPVSGEAFLVLDTLEDFKGMYLDEILEAYDGVDGFESMWGFNPNDLIRSSIGNASQAKNLAKREALAYEIFNQLKEKGVFAGNLTMPETFLVYEGDEIAGVAVKWMDDMAEFTTHFSSHMNTLKRDIWDIVDMSDMYEMAVYDYIIGNTDRHLQNILVDTSSGQLVLIDHGYSFPSAKLAKRVDGLSEFRNMLLTRGDGYYGLDDVASRWYQDDWVEALDNIQWKKLGKSFGLNKGEIDAMLQRVEDMKLIIRYDGMEEWFGAYAKNADRAGTGTFSRDLINNYKKRQLMEED